MKNSSDAKDYQFMDNYDSDIDFNFIKARNDIYAKGKAVAINAMWCGCWPNFGNGSVENPLVHAWPVNERNEPFHPTELSEAYAQYYIPDTYCLCATQELDPTQCINHKLHIRYGHMSGEFKGKLIAGCKWQREGCGLFIPLEVLYCNLNLHTAMYSKREVRGHGIFNFDGYDESVLCSPTIRTPSSAGSSARSTSVKCPISGSSSSPLKFCRVDVDVKGKGKAMESSQAPIPFIKHAVATAGSALAMSDEEDDSRSYVYDSPTPRHHHTPFVQYLGSSFKTPLRDSVKPASSMPPPSIIHPSSSTSSSPIPLPAHPTPPFAHQLMHYELNQCYYEDVIALAEPINPSLLAYKNYEIMIEDPLVCDYYYRRIGGRQGINHEVSWMLFDKCNCQQYFLKHTLHTNHGPTCLDYMTTRPECMAASLSPRGLQTAMRSTGLQAIEDALSAQPPSPIATSVSTSRSTSSNSLPPIPLSTASPMPTQTPASSSSTQLGSTAAFFTSFPILVPVSVSSSISPAHPMHPGNTVPGGPPSTSTLPVAVTLDVTSDDTDSLGSGDTFSSLSPTVSIEAIEMFLDEQAYNLV
ncbi:hypothetical protein M422DRAFT_247500 [Sphaerobolus stellatus SS14]|nr:hypothetical protein M422DRAFT_247500 [Sphaerobolus stellatus SS14]